MYSTIYNTKISTHCYSCSNQTPSMEATSLLILSSLSFLFLLLAFNLWSHEKRTQNLKLPPSPPSLPIIGHLHLLKLPLHRSLQNLSKQYGPIFYLQAGSRPMIIISSASAVEECFGKNDVVFADRPLLTLGKYLNYKHNTVVTAPYGAQWRNLRRISALEILSSNRLNKFIGIRRDEFKILLKNIYKVSSNGCGEVELRPLLIELMFNILMRMITGKRYYGESEKHNEKARQFREMIKEAFYCLGVSYPGDYLPFLQWVDPQGYLKRVKALAKLSDGLMQELIDEQRNDQKGNNDSMICHLLSLQESQPEDCTDETIKGLIQDIILAGAESSVITTEWAMANLLNHPQVLEKAKKEIENEIGQERLMDESEISKLPYLQSIISESLRLCPSGPLLVPHMSNKDCIIGGFDVPKNTLLLVNAWALHRDTNLWVDAEKFKPQRFQGAQVEEYKYRYLPFGLGRRACPGMGLANRIVAFGLGCLIQCFEWRIPDGKDIDMTGASGISMPMAKPLNAMCIARDVFHKDFSFDLNHT